MMQMKSTIQRSLILTLLSLSVLMANGQNTPPSCVITSPHNNASFLEGKDVTIRVYASDLGGTQVGGYVTKVEFFADSVKLGESDTHAANTFEFVWAGVQEGSYRITARATDNDSMVFQSVGVIITVDTVIRKAIGLSAIKGKYLGNIVQNYIRSDFDDYWNAITLENACKWGSVEGIRDVMNWTVSDRAYNYAVSNHLVFRYHVLVWGSQYPSWIEQLEPAEFQAEVEEYMAAVADRYPLMDQVEVLNENMYINTWNHQEHASGTPYFREGLGGPGETGYDWAIWLFRKARQYFPNTKLVLNDFELETNTAGRNEILDLVKVLRDSGLIDGLGTQAHYFNVDGISASNLQTALDAMVQSGLPIYVTEMDMRGSSQNEATQLASYQRVFPVYWKHPTVAGITLWGYVEGSTWVANTGILNEDGSERSAMTWLKSYMAGQPDVGYPFDGVPVVVDPAINILINPEFDYDTYAWQLDDSDGAGGTMTVVTDAEMSGDYALRICPTVPGTERSQLQVSQEVPVEAGKYYRISFLARAVAPRILTVTLEKRVSPHTRYMEEDVSLSASNQSFSYLFSPAVTDASSKLIFNVGLEEDCVFIDSVCVREMDVTGLDPAGDPPEFTVFPNPVTSGTISVVSSSSQQMDAVELVDLRGRTVKRIESCEPRVTLDITSLEKGFYLLKIRSGSSVGSSKLIIL
jgi:GH35 family endo-1,4-beta-xylanase